MVQFFDTTTALPNCGAGRLNSAIPMSGFADRIECTAQTAVHSRLMNAPWRRRCGAEFPVRQQEVHIERPDGSRGIAVVDIEAVKDSDGNIIGAVNYFQDITERKGAEEREKILAREVDHRAKTCWPSCRLPCN
jgi:hypothetical protein